MCCVHVLTCTVRCTLSCIVATKTLHCAHNVEHCGHKNLVTAGFGASALSRHLPIACTNSTLIRYHLKPPQYEVVKTSFRRLCTSLDCNQHLYADRFCEQFLCVKRVCVKRTGICRKQKSSNQQKYTVSDGVDCGAAVTCPRKSGPVVRAATVKNWCFCWFLTPRLPTELSHCLRYMFPG